MNLLVKKAEWVLVETNKYVFSGKIEEESILEIRLSSALQWGVISPKPDIFISEGPDEEAINNVSFVGDVSIRQPLHVIDLASNGPLVALSKKKKGK